VTQMVERLPSKCETLSSNPSTDKKQKTKKANNYLTNWLSSKNGLLWKKKSQAFSSG
jgi:hypothetical protein